MSVSIRAGAAYFLLVFALGFALGTIRVLLLVPRLGELCSVLLELPVILTASWLICRWLVRRYDVPGQYLERFLMGGVAFGMLLIAELALATMLFDRSVAEHVATYRLPAGATGLAGQLAFAAFPLAQLRLAWRSTGSKLH